MGGAKEMAAPVVQTSPAVPAQWEADFVKGLRESEAACAAAQEGDVGRWAADGTTGAGVPMRMLAAEQVLRDAVNAAPEGMARIDKTASLATRLYQHAKWLAERQHSTAAEQRYRESKEAAQSAGHVALATHALSRLGYFLRVWGRADEARQVLQEAVLVGEKAPRSEATRVASYLLGALERREAISQGDVRTLLEADSRILATGSLPTKELNVERSQLVDDMNYWREADASPAKCLDTEKVVHILICVCSHLARAVQQAFL